MYPINYLTKIIKLEAKLGGQDISIPEQVYSVQNFHQMDPTIKTSTEPDSFAISPFNYLEDNVSNGFKYVRDEKNSGIKVEIIKK
jgi:hypothetical protein